MNSLLSTFLFLEEHGFHLQTMSKSQAQVMTYLQKPEL